MDNYLITSTYYWRKNKCQVESKFLKSLKGFFIAQFLDIKGYLL